MKQLVIFGAGTAGTMMAHRLRRELAPRQWRITVIDQDDRHIYQPGLLLLPFGVYRPRDLVRPRRPTLPGDVELVLAPVERLDPEQRRVHFANGSTLDWDLLVVASGSRTTPDKTPGLIGPGWNRSIFDFYTLEGSTALGDALERFRGGRIVVDFADVPIKCPVAPLEMAFLLDAHLSRRGLRAASEIVFATPLDGAFTKPRAAAMLGRLLDDKHIHVEPSFVLSEVDPDGRKARAYDGRSLDYDLLVVVPLHAGAEAIARSDMGDAQGFVPTDRHTLQSKRHDHVFVIGDATDVPTSKAGSVAHFQSEVLTPNIVRYLEGRELSPDFDGHANCFIETGGDKALLIDFNYETEPLPGRFPLPGVGPFTLLEESRMNHLGKLGFKWIYWNMLLAGRELPIEHHMSLAGKWGTP